MNVLNKLKGLFKKPDIKINSEVYSEILYMNNHINIISKALGMDEGDSSYENTLQYIINNIKDQYYLLYNSNIVMYIKTSIKDICIIEFLSLCNSMSYITVHIDKDYNIHILMSGSILDYKEIFRHTLNIHNKILLSIKESLYQLECIYFEDFIKDGLMKRENFLNYNPESYDSFNHTKNGITILNISDCEQIISKLTEKKLYGEYIFSLSDVIECITISFINNTKIVLTIPYKEIYNVFNKDLVAIVQELHLDYINTPYNTTGLTIENLFEPKYKRLAEFINNNEEQKDFYEDVDEIVEYRE